MRSLVVLIMLVALALCGCSGSQSNRNVNVNSNLNATNSNITVPVEPPRPVSQADASFTPCNPYFPLKPGSTVKYNFNFPTGLVGDVTVAVDQIEEGGRKIFVEKSHVIDKQTRGLEHLQSTEKRFVCDGERVYVIAQQNSTKIKDQEPSSMTWNYKPDTLFMPPVSDLMRSGFTWKQVFSQSMTRGNDPPANLPDSVVVEFQTVGEEEITLPVGKFKALKIAMKVGGGSVIDYYVKGLGLVRRVGQGGNLELESFSHLTPMQ